MPKSDRNFLSYAVTLYFDDKASLEIRKLTKVLSTVTGNDYMLQNNVPPHLTLGMFHADDVDLQKLKSLLHKLFLPCFDSGGNQNYLPENWYPHIALSVKLTQL